LRPLNKEEKKLSRGGSCNVMKTPPSSINLISLKTLFRTTVVIMRGQFYTDSSIENLEKKKSFNWVGGVQFKQDKKRPNTVLAAVPEFGSSSTLSTLENCSLQHFFRKTKRNWETKVSVSTPISTSSCRICITRASPRP